VSEVKLVARKHRQALVIATLGALLGAGASSAQPAPTAPQSPSATLPRLPDGHPDLQGLWLKSAGGFQGLFIGSLDGTNFAAGRGPPPPRYEYTPEAELERQDRARRGYEDP
jgi:hypothetical protein